MHGAGWSGWGGALLVSLVVHGLSAWYIAWLSPEVEKSEPVRVQLLERKERLPTPPVEERPVKAPVRVDVKTAPPVLPKAPLPIKAPENKPPPPPPPQPPPVEAPKEQPEEEKKKELEEEGGVSGDRVQKERAERMTLVRSDQAATTIPISGGRISDRTVFEVEESVAQSSTERGIGDGKGHGSDIVTRPSLFSKNKNRAVGIKKGGKARFRGSPWAGKAAETKEVPLGSPTAVTLPATDLEGVLEAAGYSVQLVVEKPLPPRPIRPRRLPPSVVPTPSPQPTIEVPQVESPVVIDMPIRPSYMEEDFLTPMGAVVDEVIAEVRNEDQAAVHTGGWGEEESVSFDGALSNQTRLNLKEDELGIWYVSFHDQVARAWVYPMELRALQFSGEVILQMRVERNGKVQTPEVVHAAYPELQDAAVSAIPTQTEPLPPGRKYRDGITIRMHFVYAEK